MKNDLLLYEKIYGILKNRIESGLVPKGARLPSRAELCREFGISDKTARRVVRMLAESGLIRSNQRSCATVASDCCEPAFSASLRKANAVYADEILKSGVLLCYPLIEAGIARCAAEDWAIPEKIYASMHPDRPAGFWKRSNRIWRFFVARNENDIALRAVDSLGLSEIDPLPGTPEVRARYYRALGDFLTCVKAGKSTESVRFDDLSYLYGLAPGRSKTSPLLVSPESPLFAGTRAIERRFSGAEMRYSAVYMDILGLIATGRYRPGARLPSHQELCRIYGVSVDTTIKAVGILREWGAVTVTRGKGIFVAADLEGLKRIHISPELIACQVRRYLDSLELLSLTVRDVAANAAERAGAQEAELLEREIRDLWENNFLYLRSPTALLRFIAEHMGYEALRSIYSVLLRNYSIGRSIPKLVTNAKNAFVCEINRQCLEAAQVLGRGDVRGFAERSAEVFGYIHRLVIDECARFDYLQPAMRVYDGSSLWK